MAIIKFHPNTPVALTLMRGASVKAPSQFEGKMDYKWSAKGSDGKPATFYASEDLDQMLARGLEEDHIAVGEAIQITKIQNSTGVAWDVRNHAAPNVYAAAPNAKAAAPAVEKAPAVKLPPENDPLNMRNLAALWLLAYLEIKNASTCVDAGIDDEYIHKAATSIFMEGAHRRYNANTQRLNMFIKNWPANGHAKAA